MRTLYELCKPRQSVFDEKKREDVLNLSDLMEGKIDPAAFFEENYLTNGMRILLTAAFKRFTGQGAAGLIKLTQAMGGGKTHSLLALGLLATYPEYREKIMQDANTYRDLGKVRVVAFTGRESDAPLGIWGSIAGQLDKKETFSPYYSPLAAPGETAWIQLLQGEPLLILLDELPPYLENAKARIIGNSDLSSVTITALSNLFSALGKSQLSNVCLVISDLKAAYESGSELIHSSFKNLENEVNRSSLNIEPVGSSSDEVYHILRKRLFATIPDDHEINQVANGYREAILQAKQMGFTNVQPAHIYIGIKDSYPFHPSIRDLYARFKENPGFQQTRGLIRLMRQIVAGLYDGQAAKAKRKYLINVFDFDLNDRNMLTTVTQIKGSLAGAIAHDIAANGKAVAEEMDVQYQQKLVADVAKLILIASLADIPHALLGLTLQEIIADLCEPQRDIAGLKKGLDEFQMRAWYLEHDKDGRLFFKNSKNLIAELHSLAESFDNDSVKLTTLTNLLSEKFKPVISDCYQKLLIFPAIDEIKLTADKITLVLFEPCKGTGLHPELQKFYGQARHKNRVMFLSGQRDTMNRLYAAARELKAVECIIKNMQAEKVPEDNPQYQQAQETRIKKMMAVLSAAQQTFGILYYPNKNGIQRADFSMEFKGNHYNGEDQIRKLLLEKQKLTEKPLDDTMRRKCEDRLFTRKEMRFSEIKERAATETAWQWHHPQMLDGLLSDCRQKGLWRVHGDYVEKGPFAQEPTGVVITQKGENRETGSVSLKLLPQYGDKIFYKIGAMATSRFLPVEDSNHFETAELKVSFLCTDSSGEHPTGEPVEWMRPVTIRYEILDTPAGQVMQLQAQPGVTIKYTTDGADPKENGGVYTGSFAIPPAAVFVQVVAEYDGAYYALQAIRLDHKEKKELFIDKHKPLILNKAVRAMDTKASYDILELFKRHVKSLSDVRIVLFKPGEGKKDGGCIELNMDAKIVIDPQTAETTINNLRQSLTDGGANVELKCGRLHFKNGQAFYDYINEKHISLSEFKQEELVQ